MGFNGSGLIFIVFGVVGASWVFRFSWGQLAEQVGARMDALIQSRHVKREIEEDLALGQQALRERLSTLPAGRTEVWVTHQVNMTGLTGAYPEMGEGFLVDAQGRLRARGRVAA